MLFSDFSTYWCCQIKDNCRGVITCYQAWHPWHHYAYHRAAKTSSFPKLIAQLQNSSWPNSLGRIQPPWGLHNALLTSPQTKHEYITPTAFLSLKREKNCGLYTASIIQWKCFGETVKLQWQKHPFYKGSILVPAKRDLCLSLLPDISCVHAVSQH